LGEQAVAIAAEQFGKDIARDIFRVYSESDGVDGTAVRGTCARILARFAEEDDWSMNAVIDALWDEDPYIRQDPWRAFNPAPKRAIKALETRIAEEKDSERKREMEEIVRVLRTGSIPGAEGKTDDARGN
jgi:hypothetical protein